MSGATVATSSLSGTTTNLGTITGGTVTGIALSGANTAVANATITMADGTPLTFQSSTLATGSRVQITGTAASVTSNSTGLNVNTVAGTTTLTGGTAAATASTVTLQTNMASMMTSGTPATGARGLTVDNVLGSTTLTGGAAGTLAASTLIGAAGGAQGGAQVSLGGATASLVNNSGHGIAVNATQTVITGGTTSTSLTLNDTGATFANTVTGGAARVTGVADGVTTFDAVNFGQLQNLEKQMSKGIAATTAIANIPQVDQDKTFAVGVGVGTFNSQTAVAIGMTYRPMPNAVLKASFGTGSGAGKTVFGAGAAMSF